MTIKRVICVFGLIFGITCPVSFSAAELSSIPQNHSSAVYSYEYQELINKGKDLLSREDFEPALQCFYKAHFLAPKERDPSDYINLIRRLQERRVEILPSLQKGSQGSALGEEAVSFHQEAVMDALAQYYQKSSSQKKSIKSETAVLLVQGSSLTPTLAAKTKPQGVYPSRKETLTIDEVMSAAKSGRATILIEFGTSVVLEGKNILRFLVVDEGFLQVKMIDRNHIQIDTQKRGSTFLHVWDDSGRRTIYVEIILPKASGTDVVQKIAELEHAQQFRMKYFYDWNSYYYGDSVSGLRRRNLNIQHNLVFEGATPYGVYDSSVTMNGFDPVTSVPYYTVGLSNIPVEGTSNLNVRIFDAPRRLTPLTLPGTYLKGAFIDVNILDDVLGLSLSHGQVRPAFGYFSPGYSLSRETYVNAGKITLFPKSERGRYSFNYATGYGPEHDPTLTKQVFSLEGQHKIDEVTLNGELARDDKHSAALAGMKWEAESAKTAINFRNVSKGFTTVTSAPSNQGEVGATWTANTDAEKFSADTAVDVYQDRLYYNPNSPDAFNYDTSAHVRVPVNQVYSLDTNVRYVDTPQEISPRRFGALNTRVSREFDVWGDRKGTCYVGGSYQRSRYAFAPASEYDRCAAIAGIQVPLTKSVSCFTNYEYSWLHEPLSGQNYNPNVLNTGVSYYKEFTEKVSGNFGVSYRNEAGMGGTNSFLSGEDSVSGSASLSYNPTSDVSYFVDGRARDVWAQMPESPSYNDLDIRFGMRAAWGVPLFWDPQGIVSGFVFKDKDGNGKFDPGDQGIADVKVKVGNKEAMTDRRGWYHVDIKAKKVIVTPVLDNVPAGFIFSTPASYQVEIVHAQRRRVDFGLTTQSGIYGTVFVDKNGNGVPDQGDQFIGRVRVTLDSKLLQISDGQGSYLFKGISPGRHTISIDIATLPAKLIPLVKLTNDVDVVEGTTYVLHIPMRIKE